MAEERPAVVLSDTPQHSGSVPQAHRFPFIRKMGLSALLFLLALIPRLSAFWQGFITPDEPIWVFRAVRFMRALEMGRWVDTFQMGHPGVTTMWMGMLGIRYQQWRDVTSATAHLAWIDKVAWVTPDNGLLFHHLVAFLPYARLAVSALNALGVVGIYALASRLWDRRLALIAAALLALDPFVIGLSGLLHVDALAMTFMTLSLLAWLIALNDQDAWVSAHPRTWFLRASLYALLSGVCAGLGILSKSPAIFVAASIGTSALLFTLLASPPLWRRLGRTALLGLPWAIGTAVALFGAFPAMWTDPFGVMQRVYGLADRHLDMPHRIAFFRGIGGGDPGPSFYPAVLLFRLTPVALLGLAISLFPLLTGWRSRDANRRRAILASLWTFVIGFTAFVTIGAKKFDRYLVPVFPVLDLLAAAGWMELIRWVYALLRRPPRSRGAVRADQGRAGHRVPFQVLAIVLVVLLVAQGAMIFFGWPYYLDVYNPLAGGMKAALRTLPVGWGEGLEQIADHLNRRPGAADRIVAGGSPVTLGPLFDGEVLLLDESSRLLADHVLITALDRQIYPERVASLISGARLADTVHVGGSEVLWLYDTQYGAEVEHLARYGAPGDIILCDARSPFARHAPEADVQLVTDADEAQAVELLNRWSATHTRLWYFAYPAASPIAASILRRQLDAHAVPLDRVDLDYVTATLYILPEGSEFAVEGKPFKALQFQGQLAIVGGTLLEEPVVADGVLRFRLRWRATGSPQADYAPFVHLIDGKGHLRSAGRGDELLVDERFWPTSLWSPGESVELNYGLGLPPGLPPGRYWIVVGLADVGTGGWMPVLDEQGAIRGTTAPILPVEVHPGRKLGDPKSLRLSHPMIVTWKRQIELLGYDHPSKSRVGKRVYVNLGWLGLEELASDLSVRLSLVTADGQIAHEQIFSLSAYSTSRWRVGELIHEVYDLDLPASLQGGKYTLSAQVLDDQEMALDASVPLGTLTVSVEDRLFELPQPPRYSLDLRLGEEIALLGYDLAEPEVVAGESLSLTLYWRCESPVQANYTVFVHLLDARERIQGQQDRAPMGGRAPTSGWVSGQFVVDEYVIPVSGSAQPGPHRIEVGMYDPRDMVRLPIFDSIGNRLPDDRGLLESTVIVSEQ